MGQKLQCEKCGRTMDEIKFYTYKDGRKTEMCKDCLTMHIDNYDPSTFLWLLEKMDVPYVPAEWRPPWYRRPHSPSPRREAASRAIPHSAATGEAAGRRWGIRDG